ncbi:MAG: type II secretion system protein [Phycisphaerales bacterium]|jgi:prepilin-type N-terminal cleavage/methylation domain-containing protein
MKQTTSHARRKRAFTIVELLTVMSIIVILISLLVPALNKARRYAAYVKQKAMLHSMDAAIELFHNEYGSYPPSDGMDKKVTGTSSPYCGAMKLAEALMGQDLLGFHSNSVFRADGMDVTGTIPLYPASPTSANLKSRMGPYLAAENANAFTMKSIYGTASSFQLTSYVLCDVYERQMATGEKTGMPILYYKANTANNLHDPNNFLPTIDNPNGNIYNYMDNQQLVGLGKPWETSTGTHALARWEQFYRVTQNHMISTARQPYRSDTYILLSAGYDGEYGTVDDIFNFEWRYR